MKLLEGLATIFINTFGITQPTERQRRRASWFIFGLLVAAIVLVALIGILLSHSIRR